MFMLIKAPLTIKIAGLIIILRDQAITYLLIDMNEWFWLSLFYSKI